MSAVKSNLARKAFITVIIVFALPVILAKLALNYQWFDYGVTNYGQLYSTPISLADLSLNEHDINEQWLLLYVPNKDCRHVCQQALTTLNSTFVLLGKEIPRVTPVILSEEELFSTHREQLTHRKWQQWSLTRKATSRLKEGEVIIVDPLGNLVLKHQTPVSDTSLVTFGKEVLADMKKLLKYSRVG
ncbi:hypothetical protein [Thalassotalea sediminis]|uniref:hypothetical protein n=1 Tax=Thalassotalea sediminis TaxID=1759089 RepID=UPI0025723D12|nr:hypothetical protein [Thalassotalea sediminis]